MHFMHSKHSLLVSSLVLLLAAVPSATADGLITQLPDDGSWAEFELKLTLTKNDQKREHSAYLRLSSVGQVEHQGTKCRWVELQVSRTEPPTPDEVAKILVPEESLKSGKVTVANLIRGWSKPGDDETVELDRDRPRLKIGPLAMLLSGSSSDSQKSEKEEVQVDGLGPLACEKSTGKHDLPMSPGDNLPADITLWRHSKASFGTVKLRIHLVDKRPDQERDGVFEAVLVKSGKDAKSALPDRR
jgi:hypothetical protein